MRNLTLDQMEIIEGGRNLQSCGNDMMADVMFSGLVGLLSGGPVGMLVGMGAAAAWGTARCHGLL